ncbi:response regulator [Patulibacter americanus]|uniref:response regulator n=1 Tax=Patulibacter americanus TaxID=588672 RepID=UPI0003B41B43|nr:response regulator transcription factor [Patulibacter americanus]
MTTPLKTRLVIADDHTIVRRGLRSLFAAQPDFEVVGEAEDGVEAVEVVLQTQADLAVLDISMPRKTGLAAARDIAERRPETRVLMLSMHDSEQYFFEALKAGAAGYVLKSAADRELVEACRATMRGESVVYGGAVTALVRDYVDRVRHGEDPREDPLSPRELEVVKLIAEARTNEQIAEALTISRKTVERHRANILAKLGMRDRVELTRYAIRRGLIEP